MDKTFPHYMYEEPILDRFHGTVSIVRRRKRSEFPEGEEGFKEWCKSEVMLRARISDPTIQLVHAMQREGLRLYSRYTGNNLGKATAPFDTSGQSLATSFNYQNFIFGTIRNKAGQFISRRMTVTVDAVNSHAVSRKERYMAAYTLDRITREIIGDTAARELRASGSELPDSETLEAINGRGNGMATYKDQYAEAVTMLLKDWMQRHRFDEWLARQYKLYLITNVYVAMPTVNESTLDVELPFLSPDNYVFDVTSKDDNFKDAKYGILCEYRSIESILYEYPHITEKELEEKGSGVPTPMAVFGFPAWRVVQGVGRQALVMTCRFIVNERMEVGAGMEERYKAVVDGDNPFMEGAPAKGEKKEHPNGEELYEVVLIGGDIVARAGKCKWQVRSVEAPLKADIGIITARLDQKVSPIAPTVLMRAAAFQEYISLILKKIGEIVNDIGPATIIVDESQIRPRAGETQGEAFQRFMEGYMKDKLVTYDGAWASEVARESGVNRPIIEVRPSQGGEQTERLINLLRMYKEQLYEVLSWNPQSSGVISPYQSTASAQLAITRSEFGSWEEDAVFKRAAEQTLKKVADLLKLILYKKARDTEEDRPPIGLDAANMLSFRIGDKALNELESTGYLTTDLGLGIKLDRSADDIRLEVEQAAVLALQAGNLSMEEYLVFKQESDPHEAVKKVMAALEAKRLQVEAAQREQVALQAQQLEMQRQQQMLAAAEGDANRAARMDATRLNAAADLLGEQIKVENV
jgi:hypothetical protein